MTRGFLLVAVTGAAWFGSIDAAAAQNFEYDCDTQAEHYSVLKTVQDGPNYDVRGNISPRRVFAVKEYVTLGTLVLEPDDKSWRVRLGITALQAGADTVTMGTLEITRNGKAGKPQMLGQVFEYQMGKTYPIRLELGSEGGSATLGDHTVPIDLQAKGKVSASVICSGGEFLFTDLNLSGN